MAERTGPSARAYYRVETHLALRLRRATPSDVIVFEQRLAGDAAGGEGTAEAAVPLWARQLEFKLDRVLALLDPSLPRPLDPQALQRLVISGSGMRLECEDPDLSAGDEVLVEMLLPGEATPVSAIGEVVARDPRTREGRHDEVSVRFRLIDERDRDAIVRHVYRVELAQRQRMQAEGAAR